MKPGSARIQRAARYAVGVSAFLLLVIGVAYYLTYEPSADVGIAWRQGTSIEQRRAHERRFGLVNGREVQGRMRYDLLDLRKTNVQAILGERDVQDTDGISRSAAGLPVDYRYGETWTWVGLLVPWLREPIMLAAVIAANVFCCAAGISILWASHSTGSRHGVATTRR